MKLLIVLSTLLLISCTQTLDIQVLSGSTMGTTYTVKYVNVEKSLKGKDLKILIDKRLVEINNAMSTYIPSSEISKFNKLKSLEWQSISQDFYTTLKYSQFVSLKTAGAFDATIGPLVNLWGFGPTGKRKVPSKESIKSAMKQVGYKNIVIDSNSNKIKKLIPAVYVDLSASAKGYGVDAIAALLVQNNLKNFMVEIGGEIVTKGKKGKRDWKIAVEAPDPSDRKARYQKVLNVSNMAVATSGDYRNFFKEGGKKYSHTINFQTGMPVQHTLASVTVVDNASCMVADAWATALMALGPLKGFDLAEKLGLRAYFIYKLDGQNDSAFVDKETSRFKETFK